ncbi:aspartyl/asparaginyl beta-hydroxylase domain-containing protein [Neolewinella agarilytica]|uniref:Aspartyl/Asparaginyl beta-hydroxylase n=1 Tax=Neolewinella agarilytica TaxID=478744 RepID=A0A1H9E4L2_9BACT|nr:aspartyl/asparaginyl beta-hydroxylase domain-containing protein [Neolewinella agarilytica]SEQ20173.1 Aspartyl/Asparaginyl beta-hydroxylase [Neolewinella agarilytica]
MENATSTETMSSDRIKLPFQFNADKMLAEVRKMNLQNFTYYNVIQLRGPAHLVDSSLPFPPPADDYADGTWTDWLDTSDLKQSPYLQEVVDFFKEHITVNLIRLLRLEPGAEVKEHCDPTLGIHIERSMVRLTIPILSNDDVHFILNGKEVPLKPGDCWYLRLTDPHKVLNQSAEERINLTIDVIPNDWLRNLLAGQ